MKLVCQRRFFRNAPIFQTLTKRQSQVLTKRQNLVVSNARDTPFSARVEET
jgi:hypothetical protein